MTNGELLALAREWRAQAVSCNADKATIETDAYGAEAEAPAAKPERPWWRFW